MDVNSRVLIHLAAENGHLADDIPTLFVIAIYICSYNFCCQDGSFQTVHIIKIQ